MAIELLLFLICGWKMGGVRLIGKFSLIAKTLARR